VEEADARRGGGEAIAGEFQVAGVGVNADEQTVGAELLRDGGGVAGAAERAIDDREAGAEV
jgi:hypothetical protein